MVDRALAFSLTITLFGWAICDDKLQLLSEPACTSVNLGLQYFNADRITREHQVFYSRDNTGKQRDLKCGTELRSCVKVEVAVLDSRP